MSRGTAGMLELEMTTVLIVVSLSVGGHGLLHFPCNDSLCPPFDPDNCSYGVIKDANDCCSICANGEGDKCGGAFNVFGDCTNGTKCMVEVEFGLHYFVYIQKSGICKYTGSGVPNEPECREPCSVDFCGKDDKKKYCSAKGTSFIEVSGRAPCQHTTCKACRLHVLPDCPTCPKPMKKKCLKRFYLCVSDHYKKGDIILELNDGRAKNVTGKVVCHVPEIKMNK